MLKRTFAAALSLAAILYAAPTAMDFIPKIGGVEEASRSIRQDPGIDYQKMIEFLKKSNDAKSLFSLGIIYMNGVLKQNGTGYTITPDPVLAEKYFLKAIKKGYKNGKAILGGLYIYNNNMSPLDPDGKKAVSLLSEAYKNGNVNAGLILASLYLNKGEVEKALPILTKEASAGNADAQLVLAILFKTGHRLKGGSYLLRPDERAALFYLNKACMNERKSETVRSFCFNPDYVQVEKIRTAKGDINGTSK